MEINPLWSFKEAISKITAIKQEYLGVLSLFSCYEIRDKKKYITKVRKDIYSINARDWQKEKLWEYMNDDIEFRVLISLRNRQRGQN